VTAKSTAAAARMGTRAGVALRSLGIPSRNPFSSGDERAAWRRAYLAAARRRRRG
jgi:hypothetical protein